MKLFFHGAHHHFIQQIFLLGILSLGPVRESWAASASFSSPQTIVTLTTYTAAVNFCLADINGDGRKDIVAIYNRGLDYTSTWGALSWFENIGHTPATFTEHLIHYASGDEARFGLLGSADMDGDGRMDIVAWHRRIQHGSKSENESDIYINSGGQSPTFNTQILIDFPVYGFITDLNHDGRMDIVAHGTLSLGWYRNDGGQPLKFTRPQPALLTFGGYTTNVIPADLNGDGNIDILSSRGDAMAMHWDENNGAADPAFRRHDIDQGTSGPLTATDVNGDGRMDILAGGRTYLNNGDRPATFRSPTTFGSPNKTAAADLSGTGNVEMVSATGQWYSNSGGASPVLTSHALTMPAGVKKFDGIAVGDVTGDGNPDIVACAANKIYLYVNQLSARAVRVLTPEGGERLVADRDTLTVHWKTDVATAGTSVELELWEGMYKLARLMTASNSAGDHTETMSFPEISHTGWYRIRAVSQSNPNLFAFNEYPFILVARNNIPNDKWMNYQ